MSWRDDYRRKLMSADEAVAQIQSGERIVVTHAAGEPTVLTDALVRNAALYKDVEIVHMVPMGKGAYCRPEYKENFRHNSLFAGPASRDAIREGRGDYTPVFFSKIPELLRTRLQPDVTFLQLSPPDEHGYCSFGISVDYTLPAALACRRLNIAHVNPNMPRTLGDCFIHVSQLHCIVEEDLPVLELTPPTIGPVEAAIGQNVAGLIEDGDCLQMGIGAIPDATLAGLYDKKDLGIHTEMFSDGVVGLVEAGVITGRRKNFHPGRIVATFLMGSKKLYRFVDNNPFVEMLPVDYVNDPRIACQNDNLVAINSCVQVDLMGQVVSDSVGLTQISGVGGQVDFVRAAALSRGGRSIMAMPSLAKSGVSKVVATIDEGAAVTTSRYDVDYVVTEHGVAALKGRTLRERAGALIAITHPQHRAGLIEEYERRFCRKYSA